MLDNARVATRLPAQDLARARRFYSDKLGLDPTEERPGGLRYRLGSGEFALYASAGASPGTFTQIALEVDDLDAVVAVLKRRGVVFEAEDRRRHRRGRRQLPEQGQPRRARGVVSRQRREPARARRAASLILFT
jgi:catechol 2,3-dioxygenase-like lactoylglutathione lyase family enzyme